MTRISTKLTLLLAAAMLPLPALADVQGAPDDPYQLPVGGEQGVDMAVVDAEAMPEEPELARDAEVNFFPDERWVGGPVDLMRPVHHLYTDLRRALVRYQMDWGDLPRRFVPEQGTALQLGSSDPRAMLLRERLGLPPPDPLAPSPFDLMLEARVREFQAAHGLPVDGKAGRDTLAALNRGPAWYEQRILLNMERVRRLPAPGTTNARRYILVDAAAARLWMYEDGRPVDSMKVIVGTPQSPTPMMAALMRYVAVNPYWNIPPDLVQKTIAPRVVAEGVKYLADRRYEVLDSWEDDARVMDPATVDWKSVASGAKELRVRQLPGGSNFMGDIKFMLPNHYGIYLHDTPAKDLFAKDERILSNGCVRLEDAHRLARWIFGDMPRPTSANAEQRVDLKEPLPVYITYLTAGITPTGRLAFATDAYDRDRRLLARYDPLAPQPMGGGGPVTGSVGATR